MIELRDTFNDRLISRHRTVLAALKAQMKHLAGVKRANGRDSYLTYAITRNGGPVGSDEMDAAREKLAWLT